MKDYIIKFKDEKYNTLKNIKGDPMKFYKDEAVMQAEELAAIYGNIKIYRKNRLYATVIKNEHGRIEVIES